MWYKINHTYGVSHIINFGSHPKSLPTKVVENLMKWYDLSSKLLPIQSVKKGVQVKILKGSFADFIATVEEYETDQPISILMDLMNRMAKIQAHSNIL